MEIGAAGLLIVSFFLPWFEIAYPNSSRTASVSWADYFQTGSAFQSVAYQLALYLISLGASQWLPPLLPDWRRRGVELCSPSSSHSWQRASA